MDITQIELDEFSRRETEMINKSDVLKIVKQHFCDANNSLKIRSAYDQTIMGNMLTVIELELKKEIKKLKIK
jgi:hypothetical protein